jgi:5-methylcytosine-specific restriction protein A
MPNKPLRPCARHGCPALVTSGYCPQHAKQEQQRYDKQRGSSSERGYGSRWAKCSKYFLSQPENVFCKLQLQGCTNLSECTDHIDPPDGPNDPRFWDPNNWQGACIHCNSVKGHKHIKGEAEPFEANRRQI